MIDSKKARPDVAVRVAGSVVAVQVEKAVVLVAVVRPQRHSCRVPEKGTSDYWKGSPKRLFSCIARGLRPPRAPP